MWQSCFPFDQSSTTWFYTFSLHDALPILIALLGESPGASTSVAIMLDVLKYNFAEHLETSSIIDRKSTRLNSSHVAISYAVFCLKKIIQNAIILILAVYASERVHTNNKNE